MSSGWPWVSRELYDRANLEADRWRVLYGELFQATRPIQPAPEPATLAIVREADREGEPEPVQPRRKGAITQRIEDVSEGDPKIARHFRKVVSQGRKDGLSDGDILDQIKWVSSEDGQ